MEDMRAHLEKLLNEAEECALIAKLAGDKQKRELFTKLSEHLKLLADHVAVTMKLRNTGG